MYIGCVTLSLTHPTILLVAIAVGFDFGNIHRVRYAFANTPYNSTILLVAIAVGFDFGNIHRVRYAFANTFYNSTCCYSCWI